MSDREEEEERRRKQSLDSPQTIEANKNFLAIFSQVCNSGREGGFSNVIVVIAGAFVHVEGVQRAA